MSAQTLRERLLARAEPLVRDYVNERVVAFKAILAGCGGDAEAIARAGESEISERAARLATIVCETGRAEPEPLTAADLRYAFEWSRIGTYAFADAVTCFREVADLGVDKRKELRRRLDRAHGEATERARACLTP